MELTQPWCEVIQISVQLTSQAGHHVMPMTLSMAPLHSLGQVDQNEMQCDPWLCDTSVIINHTTEFLKSR